MMPAPAVEEVAIVRPYLDYNLKGSTSVLLLNEPGKKIHKSTEDIIFQSQVLLLSVDLNKLRKIYTRTNRLLSVSFETFYKAYSKMTRAMHSNIPNSRLIDTDVSIDDQCLYNYYEFDNKKIFFNLFFDNGSIDPIVQININDRDQFKSIEGTIDEVFAYLKANIL